MHCLRIAREVLTGARGQVSDRGAEKRATCDIAFYPATLSVRPGFLQVKRRKHKGAPSGTRLEACTIPLLYLLYCTTLYRTVLSNQEIVHIHPVPAVLRNVIAYTVRRSGPIPGTEVSSIESRKLYGLDLDTLVTYVNPRRLMIWPELVREAFRLCSLVSVK